MRIYHYAYDHQRPTGGQRSVYRHVDILNHNGYDARVLHTEPGFRLTWFANKTHVIDGGRFKTEFDPAADFLVLPEDLGPAILRYPGRKVVINQGVYNGFYVFGESPAAHYPYLDPSVRAVIVKSEHSLAYLRHAYPNQRIHRVWNAIDSDIFGFRGLEAKERLISYVPAKNLMDTAQVIHITASRALQGLNRMQNWRWQAIRDMDERQVAEVLGRSALFLFLSMREGWGRLPVEAMASGALVAAYAVPPLTEYLSERNSLLCDPADVLGVVRAVESFVEIFEDERESLAASAHAARHEALRFSSLREEASLAAIWKEILAAEAT